MTRVVLGRQQPLVNIDDFVETFTSETSHHIQEGLDVLQSKGVLPLTYMNPQLLAINHLVAWTMWSGNLHNYVGHLQNVPVEQLRFSERRLGITFRKGSRGSIQYAPNSAYGRVMSLLGVQQGEGTKEEPDRKVTLVPQLPPYIQFLKEKRKSVYKDEKKVANKVLIDYLTIMMTAKMHRARGIKFRMHLNGNKNKDVALHFAEEIVDLFDCVYPAIGLSADENIGYYYSKKRDTHHTNIVFKRDNIMQAIAEYGLFNISYRHRYHRYGKRPDSTT